jgi:3-oxoacyl-[acyl-carrier-protein] synthase-3
MALSTIHNVRIRGISACVPKRSESNMDYEWINPAERELLIKTTGILTRRIADEKICTSDMCFESAQKLLQYCQADKNDIEILVFVSQSPDYFLPATSIILQDRLGLSKSVMAFDVQLGCSGYVFGLNIIGSLMQNGRFKKGLLLVGDKSSFSQSKQDKSTYPIFGDAGTATLLEYEEDPANRMDFNLQSDGSGFKSIIITDGGTRNPYTPEAEEMKEIEPGIVRSAKNLVLEGLDVFNFSLREVAPNIKGLLEYTNTEIASYDYLVFHQANKLITESIRKKLKVPTEKVPYSIREFGNTSSASIPLTMVTNFGSLTNKQEQRVLLSAFGVGLSWGSAALTLRDVVYPPLSEI